MRRRCDPVVIPDPSRCSGGHSTSQRPDTVRHYAYNEVPELWRKHACQPWKVIFPDLEWPLPDDDA